MAHEKTWQYAMNVPHGDVSSQMAQAQWGVWWMTQAITGQVAMSDQTNAPLGSVQGVWTVVGSSDSVTAGLDGVNRLTDPSKIVFASNNAAHSWILLQSPDGLTWWCLSFETNGISLTGVYMIMHTSGPTGGGTITARPTFTGRNYTLQTPIARSSLGPGRVHAMLATDGSFFYLSNLSGRGWFDGCLFAHLMPSHDPALGPIWIAGIDWGADGNVAWPTDRSCFLGTSGSYGTKGYGLFQSDRVGNSAGFRTGIETSSLSLLFPFIGTSPFTSSYAGAAFSDGSFLALPAYVVEDAGRYLVGRLADWYLTQPLTSGQVVMGTGAELGVVQFMNAGIALLPANTIPEM